MPTTVRRLAALSLALAALGGAAARALGGGGPDRGAPPPANDPLVVHEWGTFTSMQGSDGTTLEGLQHEEERLPPFVYSRTKVRECPLRGVGYKGLEVPATGVTQKMETPVIYFHTRTPRRVRVHVDFVKGLLTQWYPVSDLLGPPESAHVEDGPLDVSKVERSFLEWDVDLLPQTKKAPSGIPEVSRDDPWSFARDVDAALVRTVPRQTPRRGPTETEHYIFYRGLGTFSLPVDVEAQAGGGFAFHNKTGHAIPAAFALAMGEEKGFFLELGAVGAGDHAKEATGEKRWIKKDEAIAGLKASVEKALVAQGLFADEARAMVRTWSRQWFASEGSRIIYIVPRPLVDGILPLSITPKPEKLERVLVGRLEYLTPETEAAVEQALRERVSADAAAREAATKRLARLDRFLEPNVRRVLAKTKDAAVRKSGEELLETLR